MTQGQCFEMKNLNKKVKRQQILRHGTLSTMLLWHCVESWDPGSQTDTSRANPPTCLLTTPQCTAQAGECMVSCDHTTCSDPLPQTSPPLRPPRCTKLHDILQPWLQIWTLSWASIPYTCVLRKAWHPAPCPTPTVIPAPATQRSPVTNKDPSTDF